MIPKLFIFTKLLSLLGVSVLGSAEGTGAYYSPGLMKQVCERRVREGWVPNEVRLHCDWPCLVAGIEHDTLGRWVVVDVGASLHLCQAVDVGCGAHLEELRERNEVIEVSWEMAQAAGWNGYTEDVKVWWLEE